jgi:hypothetical protein
MPSRVMSALLMAAAAVVAAPARAATAPASPSSGDIFLTYGTGPFTRQTARLAGEARATGAFGKVVAADGAMIDPTYASAHASILGAPRGGGYWLWKPYLVAKLLHEAADGDVVMYVDAGSKLVGDPRPLLNLARKHGFLGFRMGHQSKAWTKGDVYEALNMDLATYGAERQLSGAVLLFKKCPRTVDLVQRWLALCERPELITDAPSRAPNDPAFQDHRHDQSILTLLLLKHGVPLVLEDQTHPKEVAKAVFVARLRDGMME